MKANENIRKISEEDNPLFDLMQYRVNLEFISKSKNLQLYNQFKKIILTQFRSVIVPINKIETTIYLKYRILGDKQEDFIPNFSLNLTDSPNIYIKILILNDNEDKQKFITTYLNSQAQTKNHSLASYTRLFIINDKYYENYVYNVKNKIPTAKNEAGVIYTPLKVSTFNYIFKFTLIQIIQVFNDFGKKHFENIKSKELKSLKKENLFKQIEDGILFNDFKYVATLCNHIENIMNWIPELALVKEIGGIVLFYQSYYSSEGMVLSKDLKKIFNEIKEIYRKKKDAMRECQCLLKISIYNAYFKGNEHKINKYVQKLISAMANTQYEFQILLHFQIIWLYRQVKFNRKIDLNNYFGISLCQKYFNEDNKIKNYFNLFLKLLTDNCIFPIYDIYRKKILRCDIFRAIHKNFEKNGWKNILVQMQEKDEEGKMYLTEATKKKMKKNSMIYVTRFAQNIHFFEYRLKWYNIQECLYKNIINYHKLDRDNMFQLVFYMSYLQALENDMTEKNQNEIINEIIKRQLNKRLNLSLYKIPILIKIVPKCSDIKFDISQNEKFQKHKQLFLYNPWKKASTINYFWSKNSYQYVAIELENVLKVPLTVNNIIILFQRKELKSEESKKAEENKKPEESKKAEEAKKPEESKKEGETQKTEEETKKSEDSQKTEESKKSEEENKKLEESKKSEESQKTEEPINKSLLPKCYPISVTIPPKSTTTVLEKILMQDELVLDIIGIKYDLFNTTTEQFVNPDGNGLFFSCENILRDDYYSTIITGKKKLYVNLNDIQIYKEIPRLDIIKVKNIYDNEDVLNLYEYQEFPFNFEFKNNSNYQIDEINYFVYVYKKEDYKVCIKEGNIKKLIDLNETYNFEYKYFHLSPHYKIEFRFYLKSEKYEKENETSEELISPYIFYFKKLNTNDLLLFAFPKIIPQINSNSIEDICKMDKRLPNDYKYVYSFDKKIFSFNVSNDKKNKIFLEIKDNNNLIKKESIGDDYSKEIDFGISSGSKLSDVIIEWECDTDVVNNLKGAMKIGDIFPNLKDDFADDNYFKFSLDVDKKNNEECGDDINIFEIKYCVKNNSNKNFNNLKIKCYIYQNITDAVFSLNEDLFYEGSLISFIDVLKPEGTLINKILLYLDKKYDNYCTTFVLINPDNNTVYMSPINQNLI